MPASIAVENARLFEEARVASELRERQRWIHLIHDLYNQSLFSASLIAEVLPQLWAQDPAAWRPGSAPICVRSCAAHGRAARRHAGCGRRFERRQFGRTSGTTGRRF
ncbi:MAG: hypothetical protein R2838_16870 [Caldilineaceae bacterium]